jgi:hypothetical protein
MTEQKQKSNPPQPDKDIEELAKWLYQAFSLGRIGVSWEDLPTKEPNGQAFHRQRAKSIIAKLRTLGWEKRDRVAILVEERERILGRVLAEFVDANGVKCVSIPKQVLGDNDDD